ncbi:EF-hand domain-containing protein [Sphingomonas jeddahensis]|uniref:EF hand n=1 Tax=Sphingomonas jeddahensis TaxID=1915074 RepID=A0A1V2EW63_9SPHN|nr:EF-hand domain-containing protein [Sphingomonas jeddahensis]ONF96921.1 EF hand [Sphingomonas jeddahensis]
MLKSALFASAMIVAVPALAQQADTPKPTAPTAVPGAASVPEVPDQNEDAVAVAQRGTRQAASDSSAASPGGDHVSTIVHAEFAAYDKNGNGALEKAEFTAWMDALKARAPEGAKPSSETWNNAAFAQADKDQSTSVSKTELTHFLRG